MMSNRSLLIVRRSGVAGVATSWQQQVVQQQQQPFPFLLGSLATTMPTSSSRFFTSPAVQRYKKKLSSAPSTVPTIDMARSMPKGWPEIENSTLMTIAATGSHDACTEVLKRHIMSIDDVCYEEATKTFEAIAKKNREGMWLDALPYQIGIGVATSAAFVSLPMVFDLHTCLWFNQDYVTTDVPEPRDLETMLEVGAWSWNWMEPPLGTFSFSLLCLQFSRAQLQNLGIKPFTSWLREKRAMKVAKAFPKYDPDIIHLFSESDPMVKIAK